MDNLTDKVIYGQESSAARPALAAKKNDWWTVIDWRGNRNSENLSAATVDRKNKMGPPQVDTNRSGVAPALTFFGGQWWIAWIGNDNDRSMNIGQLKFDVSKAPPQDAHIEYQHKLAHTSLHGPALATSEEALYLAWVGRDATGRVNVARS